MIREGYQQTAIGLIPCDWELVDLVKYCHEIFLGLTSKVDYVSQNGVPLIRASDITNGKLSFQNALFISQRQHKELTKYRKAKYGDVLISKSGSLGVCALVNTEKEFSIYESIIVLQPILKKLESSYLFWIMSFDHTQKRLLSETVGSTVGHLNLNDFKRLQIPIPPLPEQKAIAEVLGDVDRLINACDKLIAKKRDIKQGAMQELLTGRSRLPGFSGEWEVKELGEITNLLTNGFVGQATKHYTESDDGIIYIQGFNVQENSFNFTGIKKVSSEFSKRNSRSILREDDLLTIQTGDVGLTTIVPKKLEGANCHALIISRFKKEKVYPKFYSQYFNSFLGRNRLKDIETGTTMKHINVKDIAILDFPVPPLEEQRAIAQILSDMDTEIEALEKKRDKYKLIKQGMMQELLTGKTRILRMKG